MRDFPPTSVKTVDVGGLLLCPGFVDVHVHGGGGVDSTIADPERLKAILRTHEAFGTTSMCLALAPAPLSALHQALTAISALAQGTTGGARLLGSYLEGPFLNPSRCGPHPEEHLIYPDVATLSSLATAAGGWLRVVTLAPELPDADALIRWLAGTSIVCAIGHTSATCEQVELAINGGCRLASHLFNGMKPFHHRDPNAAGAVLASNQVVAELICDEAHLHPATVRLAVRAMGADRILLVSDATSVVGAAEGNGILGSLAIRSQSGAARLEDGRMAGSILTMVDAVRNLIEICKLDVSTAVRSATMVPASLLGIADRVGSIAVGKYADLLVLDPSDFRVLQTYVGGERIFRSPY
jgi:N-acetylglucosamine-6-phosphate deacetylase